MIPLLALFAKGAAKGVAAKAAAKGATKAVAKTAVKSAAKDTITKGAVKSAATKGSGKLSIGMLADDKVNTYPGLTKLKDKGGDYLNKMKESGNGENKKPEFSKPTEADFTSTNTPSTPNNTYGEQIQKLKSLQ